MAYDEELAERIRMILQGEPGLSEKRMFGGLAFLIGGYMAVAAGSRGGLMLRVDPAETDALITDPSANRMVMRGREMNGWLLIDPAGTTTNAELETWVEKGVTFARSLPPKA